MPSMPLAVADCRTVTDYRIDIQKIRDLPPLPHIANELMAVLNSNDADIDDIAQIIVQDPGLTAKLLSLANSAFFGFGRNVNTISEAIINVLGLELVKSLSVGLILSGTFDTKKCKYFSVAEYWIVSLLTAELVKHMSKIKVVNPDVNPGFFYLYGLLHNLGMLVLADRFPNELNQVLATKEKYPEQKLIDIENVQLGIDHHSAAVYLANKWNLPEDICSVMGHYFQNDYREKYWEVCVLTGYCSRLSHSWLEETSDETEEIDLENLFSFPQKKLNTSIEIVHSKLEDVTTLANRMNG